MIARLLILVVSLAGIVTWLAWPTASSALGSSVPTHVTTTGTAGEVDRAPTRPGDDTVGAAGYASSGATCANHDTSGKTAASDAQPCGPRGSLAVRIEGATPHSRWMVHAEEVSDAPCRPVSLPALAGSVRIESLPVAATYDVLAIDEDAREPARRARVEGPRDAGQIVDVELREPHPVTLRARILDEGGGPLRTQAVETLLVHGDHSSLAQDWSQLVTDAEGRIVVQLGFPEGSAIARSLWIRTAVPGPERRAGNVELREPLLRGETDVGSVRLLPEPLIASGRVVDAAGRSTGERGIVSAWVVGPAGAVFRPNPPLVGRFGRDGNFAIHGFVDATQVVLRPMRGGDGNPNSLVPESDVRVDVGTRNTTLRYVDAAVLMGSVRMDPVRPRYEVVVRVAPEGESELFSFSPSADGTFGTSRLSPGLYRVWATVGDDTQNPLFDVHDVVVNAGETSRDPLLANVDLRNRLRRVKIDFDEATDQVPSNGICRVTRRDTATTWIKEFHGPSFQLTLTESAYDLEIVYGESAPIQITDVRGDQKLELRPGRSLVMRLVDPENMPPAHTAFLRARLRPDSDDGVLPAHEVWLTELRTRVPNLTPGRWRVQLELARRDTGVDVPRSPILLNQDIVVDVPEEGDMEFALDLDETAVIEALARLGD